MIAKKIAGLRRLVGWVGFTLLVLAALALVDGLIGQITDRFNTIDAVAGTSQPINGPMPENAETFGDMYVESTGPGVTLDFQNLYKGYWMGGQMWSGELRVAPDAPSGTFVLTVHGRHETATNTALAFNLRLHENEEALHRSSLSFVRRSLGLNPFLLAASLMPLAALALGASFLLSRRLETILQDSGRSEIFMIKKDEDDGGDLLGFSLGQAAGVQVGDTVLVLDASGRTMAEAVVRTVHPLDSVAQAPKGVRIKPGSIAALRR